ncbi:Nse4 C-terminal-domain-containing protein [Suillus cothurnatus]|nr:Nse4 C-terminal-domain-containing protein [Suillus cothurnatus]
MAESPLTITADDFTTKIAAFLRDNSSDDRGTGSATKHAWEKIGMRALCKTKRVPVQSFMYGSLLPTSVGLEDQAEISESDRETADRRATTQNDPDSEAMAAQLRMILQATGPLNLFRFFINPSHFGQSVENLYYLSFLFRDGLCALQLTDNNEPILSAREPLRCTSLLKNERNPQMVMEFDVATWKHAIDVFDITESIIPDRSSRTD